MVAERFAEIFDTLKIPVLVCRNRGDLPVLFLNACAKRVFAPSLSVDMSREADLGGLRDILRFKSDSVGRDFEQALTLTGSVEGFSAAVLSCQNESLSVILHANITVVDGEELLFLYAAAVAADRAAEGGADEYRALLGRLLGIVYHDADVDDTIRSILALVGNHVQVSRVYVFEDVSADATRNTYEWCADGIQPAIRDLQDLKKKDYRYDAIMKPSGMVITNDTSRLPAGDREILESQGIRAIAILPLYHFNKSLGYIGFDDCRRNREWRYEEIQLLENVAGLVSSLINRRNAERESTRSRDIVQTVTDNLDDLIYITDLRTYELKFVSKSFARLIRKTPEQVVGMPCWRVLFRDMTGPCPFCPIPLLLANKGVQDDGSYIWEMQNGVNGKFYMVKNSVVEWLDGEHAHLATAVDITYRKQYEDQLRHFATTDPMTKVYNRTWGYGKLEELYRTPPGERGSLSLCFIDIDGLKRVNDEFGHAVGDEMIISTIGTILSCIRKDDVMCRWGGDEFLLLLHCDMASAEKVMDKIGFAFKHFNETSGKPYPLSISYGLIDFATGSLTIDELIAEADRLMYENKLAKKAADTQIGIQGVRV